MSEHQKASKDAIIIALIDKYFPDNYTLPIDTRVAESTKFVFDCLDALEREQVIRALGREIKVIDLGRVEVAGAVERRATSTEISALCLGVGSLLWGVGDVRCAAFGLRHTQMAKNLQVATLNDDSIGRFLKMLSDYRTVVVTVLTEEIAAAAHAGRPVSTVPTILEPEADGC